MALYFFKGFFSLKLCLWGRVAGGWFGSSGFLSVVDDVVGNVAGLKHAVLLKVFC